MRGTARLRSPSIDVPTYRRLALRAFVLWALVRAAFALVALYASQPVVGSSAAPSVMVAGLVVLLLDLDVRATREALFLAHLGIGRRHIAALTASIAGAAELAFRIVWAAAAA